jgi:hypothetical protein
MIGIRKSRNCANYLVARQLHSSSYDDANTHHLNEGGLIR